MACHLDFPPFVFLECRASSENWESPGIWDELVSLDLSETDRSSSPAVLKSSSPAGYASESLGATGTYEGGSGLCQVVVTNRTELLYPTDGEANDWGRLRRIYSRVCGESGRDHLPPGPPAGDLCTLLFCFRSLHCFQGIQNDARVPGQLTAERHLSSQDTVLGLCVY